MSKKEQIIERLKENGCRITKQRRMLIDIILENDCSSCKEIFYKASKSDGKIGVATVYRMINALEEIGAISRKNMYKVECSEACQPECSCVIVLDDDTTYHLSPGNWNMVIQEGLKKCGYLKNQKVAKIEVKNPAGKSAKI
ncbi:transcriptional repressor [Mediterraneibacter glycyrrhizinilyticus]|uniref:Fur family transcriptional regulator n=1 Tax=Mediterraneibacter glycyrrhizinilyticus TaxID=342942 RepID=UPI001960D3DC|nr:transcriptional repressor [Mediterraneibacter glycyrrhizinilyticus]HJC90506.1 transcriptional repressor [Candidatus Mediterraneibacter excrementigallinarum]